MKKKIDLLQKDQTQQSRPVTGEELDVWEAVYKAAKKAGTGSPLTDEQMEALLASGRLKQELIKVGPERIERSAKLLVALMKKRIELKMAKIMGKEKWQEADEAAKRQLVWFQFVKRYGADPESIQKFFEDQLRKRVIYAK